MGASCSPECLRRGKSRSQFLILPMPIDGLSAILSGVGDDVAEPKRKNDGGCNPKNMDGESDQASQQSDRKDYHHYNVRYPALTEQRVNTAGLW